MAGVGGAGLGDGTPSKTHEGDAARQPSRRARGLTYRLALAHLGSPCITLAHPAITGRRGERVNKSGGEKGEAK